jgi:hypothetical protein
MNNSQHQEKQELQPEAIGCLPFLLRLTWMVLGNLALFIIAGLIAKRSLPIVMDIIFFAIVLGLIVVRYLDITKFKGLTSDEKPATIKDFRWYTILLVVFSSALWVLARFASSYGWVN